MKHQIIKINNYNNNKIKYSKMIIIITKIYKIKIKTSNNNKKRLNYI